MIFSSIRKGNEIYDFRSTILDYFEEQIQCLSLSKALLFALLHGKHTGLPLRARFYQVYSTENITDIKRSKCKSYRRCKKRSNFNAIVLP
ncbi:hypothetical protein [Pedobacter sp. SL55]|uniref:hypothetical protein n=1 Tax=Pedobacter sp. SL55 TaxID=2995161 RepID=UPI00226DF8CE|nr:hypothetical protein [Pedobacter sp. SL55]WAC40362.1 hypothetical protein OVA16_17585 [Pedobacter sp. SL55]